MIKVLITGGSGFIGTHLTRHLLQKGYHVEHIGRSRYSRAGVRTWRWDPGKQYIEEGAFDMQGYEGFYLLHLAGEGIMDKPWTDARQRSIIDSRTQTIAFLYSQCVKRGLFPRAVVSAGGIGYYGMVTGQHIYREEDAPGSDFVARCCIEWENAAMLFAPHCPVSILRTPLVLDKNEGALTQIDRKILGIRPVISPGTQWMPLVHISDLCKAYIFAMEKHLHGPYNVAAPTQTDYRGLVKTLHETGGKKIFPLLTLKVPVWAVKLLYGTRHVLVTEGSRVSTQKLADAGFRYEFPDARAAIDNLYI